MSTFEKTVSPQCLHKTIDFRVSYTKSDVKFNRREKSQQIKKYLNLQKH